MLVAPKGIGVGLVDLFGRLLECRDRAARVAPFGEWIASESRNASKGSSFFTGLRQRNQDRTAKTDIAPPALDDRSQNPASRTTLGHEQVKATAVAIATRLGYGADGAG